MNANSKNLTQNSMLTKIIETAQKAGDAILTFYTDDIEVVDKEDNSPLTRADLAAHHIIINALKELDPDTPVISEESGVPDYEQRKTWKKFWIVDPLDGTKEFIKRNGEFTVNIALVDGGEPVLGVVYAPAKQLLYYATKENGAFKVEGEGEPVRIYSRKADQNKPLTVVQAALTDRISWKKPCRDKASLSAKPLQPAVRSSFALWQRAKRMYTPVWARLWSGT
jgi:3'(2'), 5'-bisphosphate nucleotidase